MVLKMKRSFFQAAVLKRVDMPLNKETKPNLKLHEQKVIVNLWLSVICVFHYSFQDKVIFRSSFEVWNTKLDWLIKVFFFFLCLKVRKLRCLYTYIYIFYEVISKECCEHWTSPGGNTPQGTNYTATCLPSRKLSKLDEPDMQDTAGEAGTSS